MQKYIIDPIQVVVDNVLYWLLRIRSKGDNMHYDSGKYSYI